MEIVIRGEAMEIAEFIEQLHEDQLMESLPNYIPSAELSGKE